MRASLLVLLLAPLAACDPGAGLCGATAPGDLTIEAPGATAEVTVRLYDADGAEVAEVETPATLEGLAGGSYTYEVIRAWDGARAVGALDLGVGEVCVGGEDVTLELGVAEQPGSGALWTSSWEDLLILPADAGASSLTADATRTVPQINNFNALTADASGNLWGATPWTYGARVVAFAPGALSGSGEATPDLAIAAPSLSGDANFTSLSFDADGNLWATAGTQMGGFVGVVGWSAAALRAARLTGGALETEPDWAARIDGLTNLTGGTTDADGNLWITSADDEALVRVALSALTEETSSVESPRELAPDAQLRLLQPDSGEPAWRGVTSVVPAASGGLWVLAATSGALLQLTSRDLDDDGDVVVDGVRLAVSALAESLSSDGDGGVWYVDDGRVGHLDAGDEAPEISDVAAIERAGAIHFDVAR